MVNVAAKRPLLRKVILLQMELPELFISGNVGFGFRPCVHILKPHRSQMRTLHDHPGLIHTVSAREAAGRFDTDEVILK